jgi:hypothetical protein
MMLLGNPSTWALPVSQRVPFASPPWYAGALNQTRQIVASVTPDATVSVLRHPCCFPLTSEGGTKMHLGKRKFVNS